jgi:hypothetical protein
MTVECDTGESFQCPSDLVCKRRGRRAYCVPPGFYDQEPTSGFCQNVPEGSTVCHPLNLKKLISCPGETVAYCGIGHMCEAKDDAAKACCVPYQSNPDRFCSNKPVCLLVNCLLHLK